MTNFGGDAASRPRATGSGIVYMCLAVVLMVSLDATARWLLATYPLTQVIFLRCMFSIFVLVVMVAVRGEFARLKTSRPGWHIVRTLLMAGSMWAFFHALRYLPLADIVIFAFAAPLMVTALSWPLLGERVGAWRWAAVMAGFLGVLVVLRPGSGALHPAAFVALLSAFLYACLALTTRRLGTSESVASLTLYVFIGPLIAGAIGAAGGTWVAPSIIDWGLFIACGVFGGLGIMFVNAAYQRAEAAAVVPFEYTALIWAAVAGYVIWGEVPERHAWTGAAIIAASGLFILYRETIAARRPAVTDFPLQEAVGTPPAAQPGERPKAGRRDR